MELFLLVRHSRRVFFLIDLNLYSRIKAQEFASAILRSLNLKMNIKYITDEKIKPPEDKLVSSSHRVSH